MLFASVFLFWGRQALHVVSVLQEPVYLLSGLNFPVKTLGTAVATVSAALPLTLGIDALRQIMFPAVAAAGLMPVWIETVLLAILSLVLIAVAWLALGFLQRKARRKVG